MKHYEYEAQAKEILERNNAFYAFSNKQFDEQKKEGINYISLGYGLIVDETKAESYIEEIAELAKKKTEWELANNTREEIIWYELANHECQITGSYQEVVALLEHYGITEEEIKAEWPAYFDHCIENDYF